MHAAGAARAGRAAAHELRRRHFRARNLGLLQQRRAKLATSTAGDGCQNEEEKGQRDVLLLCGPSGSGKSTLTQLLLEEFPDSFGFSVSHTTRTPRSGEVDGINYHFTSTAAMQQEIASGAFVEHVSIHGNMYGTSLRALEDVNREGKIVLMDVDMHGVRSIKKAAEDPALDLRIKCLGIIPPSLEELEKRLRGRGTESEDQVQMRLKQAVVEAEFCKEDALVDATIVNYDSWSHAYPILRRLVTAQWFASRFSSTKQDV